MIFPEDAKGWTDLAIGIALAVNAWVGIGNRIMQINPASCRCDQADPVQAG